MAASKEEAIEAAIDGYTNQNAVKVLDQFNAHARIVGSKREERWKGKASPNAQGQTASDAVNKDMATYRVSGRLAAPQATPNEWEYETDDVAVFDRDGVAVFKSDDTGNTYTVDGRWTAIVARDGEDWSIIASHFSLHEGQEIGP